MRSLLLLSFLALAGCATYNVPADSDVNVGRTDAIESGTMGIVIRNVVVEDVGGLQAHVGPGDPVEVYTGYLAENLPGELTRQALFEEAWIGEPDDASPLALDVPTAGTTFEFDGRTPDWVLILKDITLFRAKYQSGGGMMVPTSAPGSGMTQSSGTESRAVRNDIQIVLWDNQRGELVATGEVESEETYMFAPSGGTYRAAVGEFVEKLIENTPIQERR